MSVINGYTRLDEYKAYAASPGQSMSTDATDDGVIEDAIEAASRYMDGETRRTFYPRVETRYFDIPGSRLLFLDDDLLELTTLTNGDATAITASDYILMDRNYYPRWGIRLKESSNLSWQTDSNGNTEQVISGAGFWGYHEQYSARAWATGSTLNEGSGLNASDLTWTVASGTPFKAGMIVKIDSELMIVSSVATNDITVIKRGDNGSTAATHSNGATVYTWQVMDEVKQTILEIARNSYSRRFGQNLSGQSKVTAAGVVISPADVTETAAKTIARLQRIV